MAVKNVFYRPSIILIVRSTGQAAQLIAEPTAGELLTPVYTHDFGIIHALHQNNVRIFTAFLTAHHNQAVWIVHHG